MIKRTNNLNFDIIGWNPSIAAVIPWHTTPRTMSNRPKAVDFLDQEHSDKSDEEPVIVSENERELSEISENEVERAENNVETETLPSGAISKGKDDKG